MQVELPRSRLDGRLARGLVPVGKARTCGEYLRLKVGRVAHEMDMIGLHA